MFGHPRPVAQCGFARVTGFCVDFIQDDHDIFPLSTQVNEEHDQRDGHRLCPDPPAHDPVAVFFVEFAAFAKGADDWMFF